LWIAARETFIDEIGNRTSEMTRHWQKSDPEFVLIGAICVIRSKNTEINRRVQQRD
jgi:hypothetical protein